MSSMNLTDLLPLCFPFVRPELVVKKLRYYARYIVVCLLLNKMDLVKVLVKVWRTMCSFHGLLCRGPHAQKEILPLLWQLTRAAIQFAVALLNFSVSQPLLHYSSTSQRLLIVSWYFNIKYWYKNIYIDKIFVFIPHHPLGLYCTWHCHSIAALTCHI